MIDTERDRAEVYADKAGEHRWRYKAANGETLADSAEGYANRSDCLSALGRVTGRVPTITQTKDAPYSGPGHLTVLILGG